MKLLATRSFRRSIDFRFYKPSSWFVFSSTRRLPATGDGMTSLIGFDIAFPGLV
jgi:hypothetical protein